MSYAFRQSGYLAGFILLALVAILTGLMNIFHVETKDVEICRLFDNDTSSFWSNGESENLSRTCLQCSWQVRLFLAFISSISLSIHLSCFL